MKKIALLLLMLLLVTTAAKAKFTYWGYGDKTIVGTYGAKSTKSGKAAIYIPAEVAKVYKGLSLTGVRIGLTNQPTTLRVFVAKDLNGSYNEEETYNDANEGLNIIKFSKPYTIDGDGFYVGYEFEAEKNVVGYTDEHYDNANFTDFGSGWSDNAKANPNSSNALSIQMRVEGNTLPLDFTVCGMTTTTVNTGEDFQLKGKIINLSASKAENFRLGYTVGTEEEKFVDLSLPINERGEGEFAIDCQSFSAKGKYDVAVRLVSVDGEADAYQGNDRTTSTVYAANVLMQKRAYMEEYTGTGCKWCVRGIVGIEKCQERFGNRFVAIAKHCYSVISALSSPTYDYIVGGGFPKCIIDRKIACDPGPTTAPVNVQACINQGTKAGIDAIASFAPGDTATVNITGFAKFSSSYPNANYRFAFAVIENNVKGFKQQNAYYGTSGDMNGWEKKPSPVAVDLMHVARMGLGISNGIENSIPKEIEANKIISYTTNLTMPSNVQNYRNLKAIALIMDKSTNYIENVIEVPIAETAPIVSAIKDVDSSNTTAPAITITDGCVTADGFNGQISIYTLDGKKVSNRGLQPGMYIVKLSNGKQTFVKKIAF